MRKRTGLLRTLCVFLAAGLLLATPPALADDPSVWGRLCSAFQTVKKPSPAEIVFEKAMADYERQLFVQVDSVGLVVRAAVQELANRTEWDQKTKAAFWNETALLIRSRDLSSFTSNEFSGSDGSILFLGSKFGVALVITRTGEIYRGMVSFSHEARSVPHPIWSADDSKLKLIHPSRHDVGPPSQLESRNEAVHI